MLPSESEGISRSMLEALFLGIPCIARDADANRDPVKPGWNGKLFMTDEELAQVMAEAVKEEVDDRSVESENLLPTAFRQEPNIQRFWKAICGW